MSTKFSTGLMAIGWLVAFIGLCFLPAAFGTNPDRSMFSAGVAIFGLGMLVVAGGVYAKAHAIEPKARNDVPPRSKKPRKAACDQCGQDEPVIQCRVHQLHLCGDCLARHYDFRSCAYVPSTRHVVAKQTAFSQAASS